MIEFFIAKKHILERKKQSIISILGIVIGITVLTVSIAISNGLNNNMINNILSISPHITITNNGYYIEDYESIMEKLEKISGVKGAIPTFSNQGILKTDNEEGSFSSGVKIQGMDLKKATQAMNLSKIMMAGKIEPEEYNKVLIGSELYDQFGLKVGDKVELTSAENKKVMLVVGGAFKSGSLDIDSSMVILPLVTAQLISESGDVLRSIDLTMNNAYDAPKVIGEVSEIVGEYRVRTWGDINNALLKALALEKTVMITLFSLIIIIAGFVVSVVLNTMVREKTRDIGILRSMGYSRKIIMRIFLLEGSILGIFGITTGIVLSFLIMSLLKMGVFNKLTEIYYLTSIPVEISFKEICLIVGATAVVIFISSVFPSYRAAKLTPVEALKYE